MIGARTARYNDNLQSRTSLGPEISREKICSVLTFLPSGISIRLAVLPQFTPRLTNELKTNNKPECGPMPNVMAALPNIGGALCSTPQSLADAHYLTAVQ